MQPVVKQKKKRRWFLVLTIIVSVALIFLLLINFFPVKPIEGKSFFENDRPVGNSHQGGELVAPSNTMAVFKKAADMGVDVLETDIHITKDGHLGSYPRPDS